MKYREHPREMAPVREAGLVGDNLDRRVVRKQSAGSRRDSGPDAISAVADPHDLSENRPESRGAEVARGGGLACRHVAAKIGLDQR